MYMSMPPLTNFQEHATADLPGAPPRVALGESPSVAARGAPEYLLHRSLVHFGTYEQRSERLSKAEQCSAKRLHALFA